jgi:hypothetical protein
MLTAWLYQNTEYILKTEHMTMQNSHFHYEFEYLFFSSSKHNLNFGVSKKFLCYTVYSYAHKESNDENLDPFLSSEAQCLQVVLLGLVPVDPCLQTLTIKFT